MKNAERPGGTTSSVSPSSCHLPLKGKAQETKRPNEVRAEPTSAAKQDAGETRGQANGAARGAVKRLTASERESLLRLNVAMEILHMEPEQLAVRARMIPYARRDLAMMRAKIKKLLHQFLDTIPQDQKWSYVRSLDTASYVVGAKRPAGDIQDRKNYGTWISFAELNLLLEGCHDHCLMCPSDKAQRRACKLRKALETIPNDTEERSDGDCPFYGLI